jgi:DNA repair protein RadB
MNKDRVKSGIKPIDSLLCGGFEKDVVTMIYGGAGSGKTNICMVAADEQAQMGSKTIYVDTEGGFSLDRLEQVSKNFDKAMQKIIFLKPVDFKEQHKIINELGDNVVSSIGMIIIDTISMLYRLEIGKTNAVYEINKMLGKQIMSCSRLARKYKIPVVITNQIYSDVERNGKNKFVGGDLLRYGSKCLIELIKPEEGAPGERIAVLRKHRSIKEDKKVKFRITEKGMI